MPYPYAVNCVPTRACGSPTQIPIRLSAIGFQSTDASTSAMSLRRPPFSMTANGVMPGGGLEVATPGLSVRTRRKRDGSTKTSPVGLLLVVKQCRAVTIVLTPPVLFTITALQGRGYHWEKSGSLGW